jgi:cytochrome d ubiquinol oxidase subunit II
VVTAVSAIAALGCLWTERYRMARIAAGAQVTLILWGWALAQYPYVIRPHLTLAAASAPETVQVMLLQVLGAGTLVLAPCLLFLFRIFGPRGADRRI